MAGLSQTIVDRFRTALEVCDVNNASPQLDATPCMPTSQPAASLPGFSKQHASCTNAPTGVSSVPAYPQTVAQPSAFAAPPPEMPAEHTTQTVASAPTKNMIARNCGRAGNLCMLAVAFAIAAICFSMRRHIFNKLGSLSNSPKESSHDEENNVLTERKKNAKVQNFRGKGSARSNGGIERPTSPRLRGDNERSAVANYLRQKETVSQQNQRDCRAGQSSFTERIETNPATRGDLRQEVGTRASHGQGVARHAEQLSADVLEESFLQEMRAIPQTVQGPELHAQLRGVTGNDKTQVEQETHDPYFVEI